MKLNDFFNKYNKFALAFSGGVDSSYLLYEAYKSKVICQPYFVKTQFQPDFELKNAKSFTQNLGIELKIIDIDILNEKEIVANPCNRCYYCKKKIFSTIIDRAKKDGYNILIDGTNASDKEDERPGMKALEELEVLSPLKISNITKNEIRQNLDKYNLKISKMPSYSCLATRVEEGTKITEDILNKVQKSEEVLFNLEFEDFRVRYKGENAKIEILEKDFPKLIKNREKILEKLSPYYKNVTLDLKSRDKSN